MRRIKSFPDVGETEHGIETPAAQAAGVFAVLMMIVCNSNYKKQGPELKKEVNTDILYYELLYILIGVV